MGTVKILFTRRRLPVSLLIRAFTWSQWSHVEIIDGQDLIGAEMMKGVTVTRLSHRLEISSRAAVVEVPCANPQAVIDAIRSQLGKKYDFLGLLGLVTRQRNWQQATDWFCSELVAWAFDAGGAPLFRADSAYRITPQHIWLLPFEAVESKKPLSLLPESSPA